MPDVSTRSNAVRWKWVGIAILLYAVFYLTPIFLLSRTAELFSDVWMFAGVVIIAAVAGYLSKGNTIWESTIAAAALVLLFYFGIMILSPLSPAGKVFRLSSAMVMTLVIVFLFSLLGAWLGGRARKIWEKEPAKST